MSAKAFTASTWVIGGCLLVRVVTLGIHPNDEEAGGGGNFIFRSSSSHLRFDVRACAISARTIPYHNIHRQSIKHHTVRLFEIQNSKTQIRKNHSTGTGTTTTTT